MMLLQYAVQGSWAALYGKYFADPPPKGLGLPGTFIGLLSSLLPLGMILSPLLIGQLADKYLRADRLQAILSVLGGIIFLFVAQARTEPSLFWLLLAYSVIFAPTTTLTNAIAFHHLKNPAKEFGTVRVGGTIGFFLALVSLAIWRRFQTAPIQGDIFILAGIYAIALGIYAISLPATHPQHTGKSLPFLDALSLLKNRNFRVFSILAFVLGCSLDFYYIFTSAYIGTPTQLGGVGISSESLPLLMMLPQTSELVIMATLGASLPRLGVKRAFAIGFLAWAVRYACLAVSPQIGFAVAGLLMHGVCFTFVFAVASLYVNEVAPPAIRASGQALVTIGLFGFGRFFGSFFAGSVQKLFTHSLTTPIQIGTTTYDKQTNWPLLFSIPLVITAVASVLMMWFFREPHVRPVKA